MIIQETLQTKVYKQCDVLVCGGGFAGISAALAAARMGRKVILLEREYMLGGLGTAGLVTIYLPLCDGMGHQVSFGIAEELFRLSIRHGWEDKYPDNWLDSEDPAGRNENTKRFQVRYNAQMFAMLAENLLQNEGVEILYGTYAVAAATEDDRIKAVIVENKSGRQAISAASYVDATGDCDIAHFAGAPTENFKQGNILAAWYYFLGKDGYNLKILGKSDVPDSERAASGKVVEKLVPQRRAGRGRNIAACDAVALRDDGGSEEKENGGSDCCAGDDCDHSAAAHDAQDCGGIRAQGKRAAYVF